MRYAIGEIVLVVIGILIALQINNWNEERKADKFEKKLLNELLNSLVDDYELIHLTLGGNKRMQESCKIILEHFDKNLPYHDSLAIHFETANIWYKTLLRQNAYEKAKTYGLDFISDIETQNMLSGLYERQQAFSETMDERQALYYYNTVVPVLSELFESVDKSWHMAYNGIIPYDYDQLKQDKRYRNILKTNIGDREYYNGWVSNMLSSMQDLEKRLQQEIKEH
jgi:hypothetical protein